MYLAHIGKDRQREQTIYDHLAGTAQLAAEFADAFKCGDWGYGSGMVHDLGKFSRKFQKRLDGGPSTDHATAGAQELYKRGYLLAAYCVAGHHAGLPDGGCKGTDSGGEATFYGRMAKKVEDYGAYREEVQIPTFTDPPLKPLGKAGFSLSFFIRMLFSCLVDADFLDTERFMSDGIVQRGQAEPMDILLEKLEDHVRPWLKQTDITTVNGRRTAILRACFEKGSAAQGVYQLTVPTGGGKTVSSLAFALAHARKHGLSRVIYVIPYTSIIEQNAQVFRDILGKENVLEDHCNVTYDSDEELNMAQLAAENWDKPVVVTTNVQFFESLFSNRSSKCRKLHSIANSVIIFDEAQMLPTKYLKPCVRAISELVYNYHSTAVLCTATQPALQEFFPPQILIEEICPDVKGQYEFFKRMEVGKLGMVSENALIQQLQDQTQALCILNSRKRVQRIYQALQGEGTFHLSTFMYPEHRKRVLREIRERLKLGKTCRVIATSLVEAGVDFDFPTVYRELAGIDSVIQAAGRCNREGIRKREECQTFVFTLEKDEDIFIPSELKLPISVAEQVAAKYEDISSLEAIHEYFSRLYHFKGEGLDAKDIIGQMERGFPSYSFPFAQVAQQFHIIESDTKTIIIDIELRAAELVQRIRWGEKNRQLVRDAGVYSVNVYKKDFENLYGAGRLEEIGLGFYVLRNKEQYTEDMGLKIEVSRGEAVLF